MSTTQRLSIRDVDPAAVEAVHNRDARALWERQRRLDVVAAWREAAGLFTERERAALAFTEAVLLLAVATINVWNRLAVSTHQDLPDIADAPAHREGDSG